MRRGLIPIGRARQRGAALFVALILLVILTLIGVTAARLQTVEERMAQNDNNYELAVQSAEAALRQTEQAVHSGAAWAMNFDANANGTYQMQWEIGGGGPGSIVDQPNWTASAIPYNGPALSNVPVPASSMAIENLPPVGTRGSPMPTAMYGQNTTNQVRITVNAQGGDATATATLQSVESY